MKKSFFSYDDEKGQQQIPLFFHLSRFHREEERKTFRNPPIISLSLPGVL